MKSALIDSGATVSIFRPEVAEDLGIAIEKGEEINLSGVGGRIKGYLHKLDEGFFKKFVVTFDEKKKEVRLK